MARSPQAESPGVNLPVRQLLPLEPGDRLTRLEFERRYEAMPHLRKAELIDGVVYVPSRVRHEGHGRQHSALNCWLVVYTASTPGPMATVLKVLGEGLASNEHEAFIVNLQQTK
jgi:hypothetical protein